MRIPPSILRIRIASPTTRFGLWLPLFLAWPLVGLAALLLAPFVVAASLVLWPKGRGRRLLLAGPRLFELAVALRGLKIEVEETDARVFIYIV